MTEQNPELTLKDPETTRNEENLRRQAELDAARHSELRQLQESANQLIRQAYTMRRQLEVMPEDLRKTEEQLDTVSSRIQVLMSEKS
jgi:hypothetical protein